MRPRRIAALVSVAGALAACSGGSTPAKGRAALSAAQILAQSRQAMSAAPTLDVVGDLFVSGTTVGANLRLSATAATGTLNINGGKFLVRSDGRYHYLCGSRAAYIALGATTAAQLSRAGRWVVSGVAGQSSAFAFDKPRLLEVAFSLPGPARKAGTTTFAGRSALVLKVHQGGATTELDVAATGPPLLLRIADSQNSLRFNTSDRQLIVRTPSGRCHPPASTSQ